MFNTLSNQLMSMVRVSVLGLAGLTASACSCSAVENPPPDAALSDGNVSDSGLLMGPSTNLIEAVCGKLSACYPEMDLEACRTALAGEPGRQIWDEFGAPENRYNAMELNSAVRSGDLLVSDSNLGACVDAIGALTCADLIGEPWSSRNPDDFGNVENTLGSDVVPACGDVFASR